MGVAKNELAAPQRSEPVEHLDPGRDGDECGHEAEEGQEHRTGGEHVVGPDAEAQQADADRGEHEGPVAEQWLAAEHREDLAYHAHRRKDDDVDLGVAEEPEDVLPQDRVAADAGIEERAAVVAVDEQRDEARGQDRGGEQDEDRCHEHRPYEDRHPEQGHARRAHLEDRGDEVHRAQDRGGADQGQADDPQVRADTGRVLVTRERRVGRPTLGRRPTEQVPAEDESAAERQQPEAQGVDAREGHIRSAELERNDVVSEARQRGDDEQEQHDRAVHRERLVVGVLIQELHARDGELGPDDEGKDAGREEEQEAVQDVQDPDLLVVDGRQPVDDPGASNGTGAGVKSRGCHGSVLALRYSVTVTSPTIACGWTSQMNLKSPAGSAGTLYTISPAVFRISPLKSASPPS